MANMITVREHITTRGWKDGSGWSYTEDYSDQLIQVDAADLSPDAPMDWSWWESVESADVDDVEITVSYYSIEDDSLLAERTVWASELQKAA